MTAVAATLSPTVPVKNLQMLEITDNNPPSIVPVVPKSVNNVSFKVVCVAPTDSTSFAITLSNIENIGARIVSITDFCISNIVVAIGRIASIIGNVDCNIGAIDSMTATPMFAILSTTIVRLFVI